VALAAPLQPVGQPVQLCSHPLGEPNAGLPALEAGPCRCGVRHLLMTVQQPPLNRVLLHGGYYRSHPLVIGHLLSLNDHWSVIA
jgi:hypothetical protein